MRQAVKVVPHETRWGLFWVVLDGYEVDGSVCRLVMKYRRDPEGIGRAWKVDLDSGVQRRPEEVPRALDEWKPIVREAVRRYISSHEESEVLGSPRIPGGQHERHRHQRS